MAAVMTILGRGSQGQGPCPRYAMVWIFYFFCIMSVMGGVVGGVAVHGLCCVYVFCCAFRKEISGGEGMIMTGPVNTVLTHNSKGKLWVVGH